MADGVLAIIPARGGSKGLPRKNLLPLGGKPLIAWTIEAALAARCVDRVVVSSEDNEILAAAAAHGADIPLRRPTHLADDASRNIEVVHHVMDSMERPFRFVALLQPTSPLRTAGDVEAAVALCESSGAPSCVSLCQAEKSPAWMYVLSDGLMRPLLPAPPGKSRRQDQPACHVLNGAIYLAQWDWLRRRDGFVSDDTVGYIMPRTRSVDIDTADDLGWAEFLLTRPGHHQG